MAEILQQNLWHEKLQWVYRLQQKEWKLTSIFCYTLLSNCNQNQWYIIYEDDTTARSHVLHEVSNPMKGHQGFIKFGDFWVTRLWEKHICHTSRVQWGRDIMKTVGSGERNIWCLNTWVQTKEVWTKWLVLTLCLLCLFLYFLFLPCLFVCMNFVSFL